MDPRFRTFRDLMLARSGLAFVEPGKGTVPQRYVQAVEAEMAGLGYVPSARLSARLALLSLDELTRVRSWLCEVLAAEQGAGPSHVPLFRRFPRDIPDDTRMLWVTKVLCHFLQARDQPCLFCTKVGTTHVLSPCQHVVCDRCFDGSSYSACPVCEHHVDRSSPFFQPSPAEERAFPAAKVRFKLVDLGEDLDSAARTVFRGFCDRKQALSPADRDTLGVLLGDYREQVVSWLPDEIPVRENVAAIFGALCRYGNPTSVIETASLYMATATDALRLVAAFSGADPALQGETVFTTVEVDADPGRWWGKIAKSLGVAAPGLPRTQVQVGLKVRRFKIPPLSRAARRTLLAFLEDLPFESLVEDMLRHRSYWVWIGEILHPHEYRDRFPDVARAFEIVRKKLPDGTRAPAFRGYRSRLESALGERALDTATRLLSERPGELARRFDHVLRLTRAGSPERGQLLDLFRRSVAEFSTPVLLTLHGLLPTRTRPARVRVYWPKGAQARGVSGPDTRPVLPPEVVEPARRAVEAELLERFGRKGEWGDCLIDHDLSTIMVPFNERTASRSAVTLPRGSSIAVETGKVLRLFLHWCEPEVGGSTTDVDLSVGFFGERWEYKGVCSFYQLKYEGAAGTIATSAGDLRSAPYPDGATEFVDVDRDRALAEGIRHAVMVVNNYAGMPFDLLERGYAGLMVRDSAPGAHFDPATVRLRFALSGTNGVFLPLVLDVVENRLHWLDTYSRGQLQFNTLATSKAALSRICPEMIEYFASGVRPSMFELALLNAAARARRVILRGVESCLFERRPGEDAASLLARMRAGTGARAVENPPELEGASSFAALYRGDLELPAGCSCYALFRERVTPDTTASDLIA